MTAAEISLALLQLARLALDAYARYQQGELTDEQLKVEWASMQARLQPIYEKIKAL